MMEIELANEEAERYAAALALEQESLDELNEEPERFETVEVEEERQNT